MSILGLMVLTAFACGAFAAWQDSPDRYWGERIKGGAIVATVVFAALMVITSIFGVSP